MEPPLDDRIAKRLAEIKQQERDLDREDAERHAEKQLSGPVVDARHLGGAMRSAMFLAGVLALAIGLSGFAITLNRWAGDDVTGARREGQATVSRCTTHGPITNRGFGYWDSCEVKIVWDGGGSELTSIAAVFTSADIGKSVRVGDLGNYRSSRLLARADQELRPWLAWLSYGIGALAVLPAFVGVLLLREIVRFRKT